MAAQPAHEADLAIENPFDATLAFAAFQVQFGHTASAARRLMRHPLGGTVLDKQSVEGEG